MEQDMHSLCPSSLRGSGFDAISGRLSHLYKEGPIGNKPMSDCRHAMVCNGINSQVAQKQGYPIRVDLHVNEPRLVVCNSPTQERHVEQVSS
eukprot:6492136-Amphidinium_carterae.5